MHSSFLIKFNLGELGLVSLLLLSNVSLYRTYPHRSAGGSHPHRPTIDAYLHKLAGGGSKVAAAFNGSFTQMFVGGVGKGGSILTSQQVEAILTDHLVVATR